MLLSNWIPIELIATRLNVSPQTIKNYMKKTVPPLRGCKIGGKYFTTEEYLEEFMQPVGEPALQIGRAASYRERQQAASQELSRRHGVPRNGKSKNGSTATRSAG